MHGKSVHLLMTTAHASQLPRRYLKLHKLLSQAFYRQLVAGVLGMACLALLLQNCFYCFHLHQECTRFPAHAEIDMGMASLFPSTAVCSEQL